ncbi:TIGR02677 family protein [Nonomuraea sp. MCN248]|uniref:TIGR02677 family protein n=1 Tax=Nonomuraea corallina TaxID=2989783 RepID=A0ABT4SFJ4_9ACTN|nr:TIGR02677 family protein [Nonomuraea corallina]MDA0635979.1 TIGR02677 family protein [Nonomuraea corallina]
MSHTRTQVFAHLDVPNSSLYRRIMNVFMAGKRRFVVHLRPEDVAEALRGDGSEPVVQEQVDNALDSLNKWGNLRADPDTGRVTTVEDFYRARYLYQLSRQGEAAERALEVFEQELGRRGELQAVALEDIRVRLHALSALKGLPDPAVVHNLLLEIMSRLDSLAANASAFIGGLQRTIDLQDIQEEAFLAYKDRLIAYLERFVSELVVKSFDIADKIRNLDKVDDLLRLAAEREAADAAPDEEDPVCLKLAEWRNRWSGLRSWFVGDRARPCQADLLRTRARQAIPDLLATISVLQERRAGRSDRSADFRALARWFAECPTEADAHRLWRAAFGLTSARHLTVEAEEPDGLPSATSWLEAPRTEISVRLRATGSYSRRGAPSKVVDRSRQREELATFVAAEREQTELARKRLATGRPALLSRLGELDPVEFRLFLRLLGDGLAAGPGEVTARTSDGSLEMRLKPVDGYAEIRTVDGVLRGPDHELTIVDLSVVPYGG